MSLPPPGPHQSFCNVSALEAGKVLLREVMFRTGAKEGAESWAPSLSFLVQHSVTKKKLVFDLGIRRDWENYPPVIIEWIKNIYPVNVHQDVVESLAKGGTHPDEIDTVCLSHCHFDHIGNTHPFTKSTFVVGGASQKLFESPYPQNPKSGFASDLLPAGRTRYISDDEWAPLGPFPRAFDFYGDGSTYIIDTPGHLSGHVNLLVRTSEDGAWLYLAGDCAHHWSLITGESEIAVGHPGHVHECAHEDKALAEESIARLAKLWKLDRVRILLAHDTPWYKENEGGTSFWPGQIPSL